MTARQILEHAADVVDQRRKAYGAPDAIMAAIAARWSLTLGQPVTAAQVTLCMIDLKLARLVHDPSYRDGVVDVIGYATQAIRKGGSGETMAENLNALGHLPDFVVALDRLQASAPAVESVSLVVAWFGDDLRAGHCKVRPAVEVAAKATSPRSWSVNGVGRGNARVVSTDGEGRPVYGGTPADFAVVQAIQELRARGLRVTFYPFILMDVPAGNDLPDPYSDDAATLGQPTFPWRGRITCSPAAGYAGSVDKTAAAGSQVAALFGSAQPSDFAVAGESVSWTGPSGDWGLRRMILHYAHLCAAAGGIDAFLIGSEMRGLTTIRDGGASYPAVAAFRGLLADVRSILGAATELSYAGDWSEYFGHHPADGSGDVYFHLDPLWADPDTDFVGIDNYMPLSDWRDGFEHPDAAAGAPAIYDHAYLQGSIAGGEGFDWFTPATPIGRRRCGRRSPTARPTSHGSSATRNILGWWENPHVDRPAGVESGAPTVWVPQSKPIIFTEAGCPAIDRGTNQPNVFFDPKSAESALPWFSRGWRDDAIQRAYLEATWGWWGAAGNNPVSPVYGNRMVRVADCAAWTWDARPYPFFPELGGVWTDGPNWRLGHWLSGRLGAVSLAALVRDLCRRAGMLEDRVDVSGLWGAVEGYLVTALESPRASIATLARHFGFDAVESAGVIRFVIRERGPVAVVAPENMVAASGGSGEVMELTRAQETELPQVLKWTVARADEEYDTAVLEAARVTAGSTRVTAESFPLAAPPEEAERRCRRALAETWVGRETTAFALPPSRLALDPGDVVQLAHDGRLIDFRITGISDAGARRIEAVRQDRAVFALPPGGQRPARLPRPPIWGAPEVVLLDLPQLRADQPAHQPLAAAFAKPWPGRIAVWRSSGEDGFELVSTFGSRARIGRLVTDLYPGPVSRFDLGNALVVDLLSDTVASVTDLALFGGANALAVESAPGVWEVLQAGQAELLAPGRYRLTRLLRGQRGTELAMGAPTPAGARVVVLDQALSPLPISEAELGLPATWRIGPALRPPSHESYVATSFTPEGMGLRPFSVAHVEQPWRTARVPGDLVIRWTRRSRALAADSWTAAEAPLAEESEAFQVEILDGAAVLRTLVTATTSVTYTAAQQIADLGALLGPGDTLDFRVFQLSTLVGRGTPAAVTLQF